MPVRLKSAYREKPAAETPEEPPQPSESVRVEFVDKTNPDDGTIASVDTAIPTDEAGAALRQQLQHLRASEQAQKDFATQIAAQRAAQMASPAPTLPAEPEARIALWRQHGLSAGDADFLSTHLELAAEPHLCRLASDEAALHHERDTDSHRAATLEAFRR